MPLTNEEFTAIVRQLRNDKVSFRELKTASLSKQSLRAALDSLNDDFDSRRVAMKGVMDVAAGETLSNRLAKKLYKAWMKWKERGE